MSFQISTMRLTMPSDFGFILSWTSHCRHFEDECQLPSALSLRLSLCRSSFCNLDKWRLCSSRLRTSGVLQSIRHEACGFYGKRTLTLCRQLQTPSCKLGKGLLAETSTASVRLLHDEQSAFSSSSSWWGVPVRFQVTRHLQSNACGS